MQTCSVPYKIATIVFSCSMWPLVVCEAADYRDKGKVDQRGKVGENENEKLARLETQLLGCNKFMSSSSC